HEYQTTHILTFSHFSVLFSGSSIAYENSVLLNTKTLKCSFRVNI
ncbi:uncharacterized protein METZ01_LOCUS106773, partial [marine metagenome]